MSSSKLGAFTDYEGVSRALNHLHDSLHVSWPNIAKIDKNGPPPGTLHRIANDGYKPEKWRKWYGLPETELAPVCSVHGVVHCYDCASEIVKAKPKPRVYKRWRDMPVDMLRWALENRELC